MLYLARKVGESLVIPLPDGQRIEIEVGEMKGPGRILIGVDAPKAFKIHRGECFDQHDEYGQRKADK